MKKGLLLVLTAFTLLVSAFAADFDDKKAEAGKNHYLQHLKPLFGDIKAADITPTKVRSEWKAYFKKGAAKFIKEYSKKYPKSESFLKSPEFQKIAPELEQFFMKYSADSGNMPSCG